MYELIALGIYALSIPLWLIVWRVANGYQLARRTPMLWLPFGLALLYLAGNAGIIIAFGGEVGTAPYEESRFVFIGERARIAVQATASVLIVATLVYGLSIQRVPVEFVRFMVYSFVALLGLMAPLLWMPEGVAEGLFVLRHFQTVALTMGLFLCVGGIVILLRDLLEHGEPEISLATSATVATRRASNSASGSEAAAPDEEDEPPNSPNGRPESQTQNPEE